MAYVLKIKYENNLRRLSIPKHEIERELFTFASLESRIREVFKLPTAPLAVTYTDEENEAVTMGNDQDLKDALVEQALNPLRIHVTLSKTNIDDTADNANSGEVDAPDVVLKRLLRTLSSTPETIGDTLKQAFQAYGPLFEGVKSPAQIPGLVENVLQTIAAQVTTAVKNGAAAAATAPGTSEADSGSVPAQGKTSQVPQNGTSEGGQPKSAEGADSEHEGYLTVHHGVCCDSCGVSPILGNRWKSKEKFDFDLCNSCFEKHGNEKEYGKVEKPKFCPRIMQGLHRTGSVFQPPQPLYHPTGLHRCANGGRFSMGGPFCPRGHHRFGPMTGPYNGGEKLYCRFVCDVTVFDGTEVSPGTRFVKIWRLRNSGTAVWPANTNLVFVGGDELGHAASVPLEIPEEGLAPEAEMEASVDMVAPEKPGRYVSHWRLASPAGPKFGQRLSVTIQVVPKTTLDEDIAQLVWEIGPTEQTEIVPGTFSRASTEPADEGEVVNGTLNLDTRSFGVGLEADLLTRDEFRNISEEEKEKVSQKEMKENASDIQTGNVEGMISLVGSPAINSLPAARTEVGEKTAEDVTPVASEELQVALGEDKAVSNMSEATLAGVGRIAYPVLASMKNEGFITSPLVGTGVIDDTVAVEKLRTTEALLGKLEVMGFTDAKLNAELLEKNGFDLRKTLDDLCAAEEWDPILEELEEMGFYDTVMNRRLLFKNNGSVKRVVKELVQMYRDIQGKREKVE